MGFMRPAIGLVASLMLIAACGSTDSGSQPSVVVRVELSPATTAQLAPSPAPTSPPAPAQSPGAAPSRTTTADEPVATAAATAAGPVVLASTLYPYRITVPAGPTAFDPARAPWNGITTLGSASVTLDRARAPGSGGVFIAMTDTPLDADAFAALMDDRMQAWHGCTAGAGHRPFDAGDLRGVGFIQRCAGGDTFVRAVVVGRGHALFAFSGAGVDVEASLAGLIELLRGVEWTGT